MYMIILHSEQRSKKKKKKNGAKRVYILRSEIF